MRSTIYTGIYWIQLSSRNSKASHKGRERRRGYWDLSSEGATNAVKHNSLKTYFVTSLAYKNYLQDNIFIEINRQLSAVTISYRVKHYMQHLCSIDGSHWTYPSVSVNIITLCVLGLASAHMYNNQLIHPGMCHCNREGCSGEKTFSVSFLKMPSHEIWTDEHKI